MTLHHLQRNDSKLQLRRKMLMYEEFVKEYNIKDKSKEESNKILVQNIIKTTYFLYNRPYFND